jgi:hypothetical protein
MFAVSASYTALHFWAAPVRDADPAYVMHFGLSIFSTWWTYWTWALGPARLPALAGSLPDWIGTFGTVLLTAALAGFAVWNSIRKQWAALLPLAWFVVVLAPVLPLRNHITSYYLTLPAAGVAWLAASAVAAAPRDRWYFGALAVALAGIYVTAGAASGRLEMRRVVERSHTVRTLVWGAVRVRQLHPGKAIVFKGLRSDVFWAGIAPRPFRLAGVSDVYVAPEAEAEIKPRPEFGRVLDYVIPPGILLRMLDDHRVVVYAEDAGRLRALTLSYMVDARRRWKHEEPRRVDVGQPSFAGQLGPTWYEIDSGHRWMPRRATVRLGGPRSPLEKIHISGYCPAAQVSKGPLRVTVEANEIFLGAWQLSDGDAQFELAGRLPPQLIGKESVDISVAVDRTSKSPPDRRELGLVFGTFEIR